MRTAPSRCSSTISRLSVSRPLSYRRKSVKENGPLIKSSVGFRFSRRKHAWRTGTGVPGFPSSGELFFNKRKQLAQLFLVRPAAVFANLEGFGMANGVGFFFSIPVRQGDPKAFGDILAAGRVTRSNFPTPFLLLGGIAGNQLRRPV